MTVTYYGREGRRTQQGYKILHIIEIDGRSFEIAAKTKEEAILAAQRQMATILPSVEQIALAVHTALDAGYDSKAETSVAAARAVLTMLSRARQLTP
jgi:hypothetical protein